MIQTELSVRSETRPIPKPEEMAAYNAIVPGAAERFFSALEAESVHRREMDKLQTNALIAEMRATTTDRRIGLWLSFLLAGAGGAALVYMALQGVSIIGMAPVLLAFGSLIWAVRRSTTWPPIPTKADLDRADLESKQGP